MAIRFRFAWTLPLLLAASHAQAAQCLFDESINAQFSTPPGGMSPEQILAAARARCTFIDRQMQDGKTPATACEASGSLNVNGVKLQACRLSF